MESTILVQLWTRFGSGVVSNGTAYKNVYPQKQTWNLKILLGKKHLQTTICFGFHVCFQMWLTCFHCFGIIFCGSSTCKNNFHLFFSSLEFLDDLLVTLGTLLSANIFIYIYIYLYIHDIIDIHDKSTLRQFARWQVSKTHGCLAKPEVYWPEIQTKKWANLWDSVGASMTVHVASCNMCWKYYAATCSVCLIFLQTHTHTRCYGWCTAFAQLVII